MPDEFQRHATEMFRDYWAAASGRTATKRDWGAAWRLWLNKDFPNWHRQRQQPPGRNTPSSKSAAEQWMEL